MPKTDWTWFSKEGFFNLSTSGIWGLIIHCSVRGSPAHCDWFSSIPGLYSLDSRKITPLLPQVMVIRVIFRHYQVSPSGERQSSPPPLGTSLSRSFQPLLSSSVVYHVLLQVHLLKIYFIFSLLMISLFVLKALHSVVHVYFFNNFFAFNSRCYSLSSLLAFILKWQALESLSFPLSWMP